MSARARRRGRSRAEHDGGRRRGCTRRSELGRIGVAPSCLVVKWVTRKSVRVNRTATAWFVLRFVDPDAELVFTEPERVAEFQERERAIGFDAPGARYRHEDEQGRCSFEALVDEHRPHDPALRELARIVHGADFAADVALTPESAGLRAISHGFPLVALDDHETVARASFLYDSLYAALRERLGAKPC